MPNFAIVQVVGCLARAGDPGRSARRQAGQQASAFLPDRRAERPALGDDTLLLTSVKVRPRGAGRPQGRGRGLIYRSPGETRLDVTALRSVTSGCDR
jgi:hypothetical protein